MPRFLLLITLIILQTKAYSAESEWVKRGFNHKYSFCINSRKDIQKVKTVRKSLNGYQVDLRTLNYINNSYQEKLSQFIEDNCIKVLKRKV